MNDIPIAVISGASRGAFRSGRYASRSIVDVQDPAERHRNEQRQPEPQMTAKPELSARVSWCARMRTTPSCRA
jgi:hypothetical protein